jgi:hypothetical protein
MLSQSDVSLSEVMKVFASFGVEAAYFVPTQTGLGKSIIDAHESLRHFLKSQGIHDFSSQAKGASEKVHLDIDLARTDWVERRKLSLYRPETKNGDPRFWISRLNDSAQPGNLIAIFVDRNGQLTLVNCSDTEVWQTRLEEGSPLNAALSTAGVSPAAHELLGKLRELCRAGYIRSLRDGPTGVGFTLEEHLGIRANSSKEPDFKGIELKAGRVRESGRSETRSTLFSKTPAWSMSNLRNGGEILNKYGYANPEKNRLQLYCSLNDLPNTQGLFLRLSGAGDLVEMRGPDSGSEIVWPLTGLENALREKHKETFWVLARQRQSLEGPEEFLYERVVHTRRPLLSNLGPLISVGKVEVDLTLSRKPSGGTRDHGYLFKIWPRDLELLFPPPVIHDLAA